MTSTPPEGQPPKGTEAERVSKLEGELGAVRTEQQEQRGMLETILGRLPGPKAGGSDSPPGGAPPSPASSSSQAGDIGEQVRAELAKIQQQDADARTAADKAKGDADWRAGVDARLEKLTPERQPREPEKGLRGRVQRLLVGRD